MSRFRDFDAARAEFAKDPVAFQLGGYRFECLPLLPADTLFAYLGSNGVGARDAHEAAVAFVVAQLADEADIDRFRKALGAADYTTAVALVEWMVEEYTGRPTQRPPGSPDGGSTGGRSSSRKSRATSGQ